jgi:teichuronic acid exporter
VETIKTRTLTGVLWNSGGNGSRVLVRFATNLILVRMLMPTEFGLFALVMIFIALGSILSEGGFGAALVHHKNATHLEESSVFYFNIGVAASFACLLVIFSPLIARFFDQPDLPQLLAFVSIGVILGSLGTVQRSVCARKLHFKPIALASISGSLVSGLLAIYLASVGFGVWALAWQAVVNEGITSIVLWATSRWKPLPRFSWGAIYKLGAFGSRLLGTSIFGAAFDNANSFLIGKFYSVSDLGYFSRAQAPLGIPVWAFSSTINQVLFPALVHLRDSPEEFLRAYRRALQATIALSFPMMVFAFTLAEPLFVVLFSEKWLPSVPYFQILCVTLAFFPWNSFNLNIFLAMGRSDLFMRAEVLRRLTTFSMVLAAMPHGITAMLKMTVVGAVFGLIITLDHTRRTAGYGLWRQLCDLAPYLLSAIASAAITSIALFFMPHHDVARLAIGLIVFFFTLAVLNLMIPNNALGYLLKNLPGAGSILKTG